MTVETAAGIPMSNDMLVGYLRYLVDRFFKILPIKENKNGEFNEGDLIVYIESLQTELLGCQGLILALKNDPAFVSLLNILQYMIDNEDCSKVTTKREVFRAISICNFLRDKYSRLGEKGGDSE